MAPTHYSKSLQRFKRLLFTLVFFQGSCILSTLSAVSGVDPYAIFAINNFGIGKIDIKSPFPRRFTVFERFSSGTVTGLEYHFKKNLIFWTNSSGAVWQASLSDGSNDTAIMTGLTNPTDLAVDWINNKLYVTVKNEKIMEYDLATKTTGVVIETSLISPAGIVVYPYPNYGSTPPQSEKLVAFEGDFKVKFWKV